MGHELFNDNCNFGGLLEATLDEQKACGFCWQRLKCWDRSGIRFPFDHRRVYRRKTPSQLGPKHGLEQRGMRLYTSSVSGEKTEARRERDTVGWPSRTLWFDFQKSETLGNWDFLNEYIEKELT